MNYRSQEGVALFISLMMLLVLTVLGLSSIQSTNLQFRMSQNAQDTNRALQASESAINDAESWLATLTTLTPFDETANPHPNTLGRYNAAGPTETQNWDYDGLWSGGLGTRLTATASTSIGGVAAQPQYIIEFVKTVVSEQDRLNLDNIGQDTGAGRTQMFRVTTYGTGARQATVMVQTTYGKRF